MAFPEGLGHDSDAGLVALQRRPGGRLRDGGGIGGALGLDLFHGVDEFQGAGGIADAPAGHGIGLGHAVEDDGLVMEIRAGHQYIGERFVVEPDVLVDIVAGDDDLGIPLDNLTQGDELRAGIGGARGVGGAVDDHQAGALGDGLFQLFRRDLEALFQPRGDDDRVGVRQQHHVRVGYPVGGGDDDLVACIEERLGQVVEALLAADGHQDLIRCILQSVVAPELLAYGLSQFLGARHGGVLGEAGLDGLDGRRLDGLRGVEIRLSGAETDDVLALRAQLGGTGGDGEGGRGLDALYALG